MRSKPPSETAAPVAVEEAEPEESAESEEAEEAEAVTPPPGGVVRLCLESTTEVLRPWALRDDLERFLAGAVTEGLVREQPSGEPGPGVASTWKSVPGGGGETWTFRVDPAAGFPDGSPVFADDVIATWEDHIREEGSVARWLLRPVAGSDAFARGEATAVEGLEAREREVVIRTTRPTPDLPLRLTHPSLAVWRGGKVGPGPFRMSEGEPSVTGNPHHPVPASLDRVDLIRSGEIDPASMIRLGEADIAVVYDRSASRLLREPPAGHRLERLPAWDRTYALWANPGQRWSRDPSFRRWVHERMAAEAREAMVRVVFHGQAEPAYGLLAPDPRPTAYREDEFVWKVPEGTEPKLTLGFDSLDERAAGVAARVKAAVEGTGVVLELVGEPPDEFRKGLAEGRHHLAVIVHRPWFRDPVLSLEETLSPLGDAAGQILSKLETASGSPPGSSARRVAAAAAESDLMFESMLVLPLVRAHAWVATPVSLTGVRPDSLGLEDARWSR